MAIAVKQSVDISFAKGLDTKTDPWRVSIGNFLSLENMIFTTGMRLTKRNGYGALTTLPSLASYVTTFNGNLTAIGSNLQAYSSSAAAWFDKGTLQPVEVSTLPLIRSNTNQSQIDTAIAANGLICSVYTDQDPTNLSEVRYLYVVADNVTGQNIIEPTVITSVSGTVTYSPRVFLLGSHFLIIFTVNIGGTYHLQYIAISTNNPSLISSPAELALNYTPSPSLSWDGVVVENTLYYAYNSTAGGQSIKVSYITSTLIVAAPVTFSHIGKVTATIMSVTADTTNPLAPIIYASYYDSGSSTGNVIAVDKNLHEILTPTTIISSGTISNLTSAASNGVVTVYYEVNNNYGYDSSIPTHYINTLTVTQSGTVSSPQILVRSVGLASKAFIANNTYYFLSAYQSEFQSTYFLMNGSGQIVSRIAYANGGGYLTVGLPSVMVSGSIAQIGYLYKDFITSENASQSISITKTGIYSQTGINLVTFTIGTSNVVPAEIAQTLNLSGGFLWEYDGYQAVEQNFFLWADDVEGSGINTGGAMVPQEYQYQVVYTWTNNQGNVEYSAPSIPIIVDMSSDNSAFTQPVALTPTGTGTAGQYTLTVSSTTGLMIGQYVTDTSNPSYITINSYITNISGSVITLNQPLFGSPSGDNLSISSICSVTLNIPTLRLTYKIANPVKIEIFRWSTAQEEFYQVTSIEQPLINDPTVDFVTYTDTQADNQILGNSLIYTTGDVIENIGPPSFNALTLFDDRLWGIDAEDPNLLWYSKQVIEATPVEMSDLLTFYVAPTLGSQGSTGTLKCIAPMDDKLIMFKANALYYINGTGPDNTGANSQYSEPFFITSVVGCSNQQSIVFMPNGLMFQSDKGIWLLGRGMDVSYIGAPVEAYTKTGVVQSAIAIPGTTQVRFTLNTGITLMYDYFYEQWAIFAGVNAISSTLYQDLHTFINANGGVYQETPGVYLDGSNPVTMSFTTSWINLAGLQGYQRAYFFYLLGQYVSPHYLQVGIAYNYNPAIVQSVTITPSNYSVPYGGFGNDEASPYGQETPYGGGGSVGDIEQWRVFLANQRSQAIQLTIQEIYDASLNVPAGEGLRISGLNFLISTIRPFRAQPQQYSVGGGTNGRVS
jgi:hypothetical protein